MGIDQSTLNNDEEWDHKITFPNHPINPIIDPINFQNMLDGKCENIIKCGIPVSSSNDLHPYLTYKGYCWIFLATPGCITDNNWGIAGLFPLKKFKKLLAIDPIYQIPDHGNYHLSQKGSFGCLFYPNCAKKLFMIHIHYIALC